MKLTRRLTTVLIAVTTVGLGVPGTLYASHRFEDVPSGKFYHDAVAALDGAGITNGCSPTEYCPERKTTRGEMAAFLQRGLGRVAHGSSVADVAGDPPYGEPAAISIRTGGVSGGTVFIELHGSVTVYSNGDVASCPCEIEAFIYRRSDKARMSYSVFAQLPAQKTSTGYAQVSLPLTWAVQQPSNTSRAYAIAVFVNSGSPTNVRAEAGLTATAVPFGSSGTSSFSTSEADGTSRPRSSPPAG